jgi:CRP/FNR family cyclic AMP-dependent transcriptional regulator
MQMFEQGLSLSQLYTFFHWLHGAVRDHLFQIVGTLAWAKALTAIGAAYMKRMIPLRTMAMLGNVFGVAVGIGTGSLAAFIEHAVNLPLNATRLREMRRLIASVRGANSTELNIEWLKPFMHPRALKAGSRVFSKGDEACEAFLLVEGRIVVPEISATLEPGAIFGEMALFTAAGQRTASAVCASDVRLLVITYEQFEQLYFQNPEFGLYLVRLIVRRFEMNHAAPNAAVRLRHDPALR